MESISYIKLHRRLLQWEWYKNHTVKDLFIHCLCRANFSEQSFEGMTIKRGQFVTSIKSLADELGFTEQQIRTALKKLKLTNEITSYSTNKYTVITVVNWDKYQDSTEFATNKITSNVTNEQQADLMNKLLIGLEALKNATSKITNKNELEVCLNSGISDLQGLLLTSSVTNEQQTNNNQITIKQHQYKNDKEGKECKEYKKENFIKEKIGRFTKPTLEEVQAYCIERGNGVDAQHFVDYYEAKGWIVGKSPMKDWKAAVRTWERNSMTNYRPQNEAPKHDGRFDNLPGVFVV